ncbi:MAG TPA: alcohol dehydrogenase catalytic domain-containing protein [Pyrinomonadaceae bacterium]|nr:alcohol dehydrogenase catalytic domain-containing protein [Pyrinomonadaceae bacterium]
MLALRYEKGAVWVAEVARPAVREGEALVRVVRAGVCNTDVEIVRGYAGFEGTLGHEFVGIVESAPEAAEGLVGRRVVGEINAGCGRCELCRAGDARHCPGRTVLGIVGRDGAFAEYLSLPAVNLLPVPDEVSDERAVFTEPLAAACGIMERVAIDETMRVGVIGDGKLGLLCAQAVRALTKASVLLVGRHESKMRVASRRGIETTKVEQLSPSTRRSFDVTIEASGSPTGFRTALELLRPRGTLVLKSTFHGATEINAAPVVVDEIQIVGSRCGRFAPALELLRRNAVDVDSLISEDYALSDGVRALTHAQAPGILKVLLRMSEHG